MAQPSLREGGLLILVAVILLGSIGAYGLLHHERSVEAYCQTWKQEGQKLHDQWDDAQRTAGGDPVASIAVLLGSASELAGFFGKLSKVAPEEIAPDVVRYKEALEQVASNLRGGTNLLELVFSQLAVSAQAASVERRVDTWTKTHCGQGDLDG